MRILPALRALHLIGTVNGISITFMIRLFSLVRSWPFVSQFLVVFVENRLVKLPIVILNHKVVHFRPSLRLRRVLTLMSRFRLLFRFLLLFKLVACLVSELWCLLTLLDLHLSVGFQ